MFKSFSIAIVLVLAGSLLQNYGEAAKIPKPLRTKSAKLCLGCAREISTDDKELNKGLNVLMQLENANLSNLKILKATVQTVAGYKYKTEFEADLDGKKKLCKSTFIVKPWEKIKRLRVKGSIICN
uniref:Venom cystatin 9 n=1 Tax=Oncocephalus sp. TaxID=2944721 RepID=A0AB38ZER9_9HEMI